MKKLLSAIGIILMAGGAVLGLDGLKVITLIPSSHHKRWLALGAVLFIAGIAILIAARTKMIRRIMASLTEPQINGYMVLDQSKRHMRHLGFFLIIGLLFVVALNSDKITASSIDLAHHYTLAAKLARDGTVLAGYTKNLGEMANYPSGSHKLVALLTKINPDPLENMIFISLIAIALIYSILAFWLLELGIAEFLTGTSIILLFCSLGDGVPLFGFEVIYNYFFSQLVGFALGIVALFFVSRKSTSFFTMVAITLAYCFIGLQIHLLPTIVIVGALLVYVGVQIIIGRSYSRHGIFYILLVLSIAIFLATNKNMADMAHIAKGNGWLRFKFIAPDYETIKYGSLVLLFLGIALSGIRIVLGVKNNKSDKISGSIYVIWSVLFSAGILCAFQYLLMLLNKSNPYSVKKYLFCVFTFFIVALSIEIGRIIKYVFRKKEHSFIFNKYSSIWPILPIVFIVVLFRTPVCYTEEVRKYRDAAKMLYSKSNIPESWHNTMALFNIPPVLNYLISTGDLEFPRVDSSGKNTTMDVLRDSDVLRNRLDFNKKFYLVSDAERYCRPVAMESSALLYSSSDMVFCSIKSGQTVMFNSLGGRALFVDGYSVTEAWGVWSDGDSTTLRFSIPKDLHSPRMLFDVSPFLLDSHQLLNVNVLINGKLSDHWLYNGKDPSVENKRILVLPVTTDSKYEVKFEYDKAVSPHEVMGSSDQRKLGLAFRQMTLLPD